MRKALSPYPQQVSVSRFNNGEFHLLDQELVGSQLSVERAALK